MVSRGHRAVPPLKVGVAQIETLLGDLPRALDVHLEIMEQARSSELDLLLFPELSLIGHHGCELAPGHALSITDPIVRRLAEVSGPMCTVFGLLEESGGARYFNTSLAVRDGRIIAHHRKLVPCLYGKLDEGKYVGRGSHLATFPAQPWTSPWYGGILICNDLWHPPYAHLLANRGATILLVPVSSGVEAVSEAFDNPSGWMVALKHTAMVYGLPVLMANRTGVERDLTFWGGSCILDPRGQVVAQAGDQPNTLLTLDLDYDQVRQARLDLPILRDTDLSHMARLYQQLVDGL